VIEKCILFERKEFMMYNNVMMCMALGWWNMERVCVMEGGFGRGGWRVMVPFERYFRVHGPLP